MKQELDSCGENRAGSQGSPYLQRPAKEDLSISLKLRILGWILTNIITK